MSRPNAEQMAMARRLLEAQGAGAGAGAEARAEAAGAVYDKLDAQLAPLLGEAGFRALFARCAKLAHRELAAVAEVTPAESSAKLRAFLRALEPEAAAEAAELLFGTFFALLATFIGERLTAQALRRAWPTIEEPTSAETKK